MNKFHNSLVAIAITAFAVFLVWYFSNIVGYILISFVLTILGNPLVCLIEKLKIGNWQLSRWLSAVIVLLLMWTVAIVVFCLFVPIIIDKSVELASLDYSSLFEQFRVPLMKLETFLREMLPPEQSQQSISQLIGEKISSVVNIETVNRMFSSLTDLVSSLVIALFSISFITFFFLKEDHLFENMLIMVLPKRYEENLKRSMSSINKLLERYFVGIFCESLVMLIFVTIGLRIIGVSLSDALVVGLISSVLNVIPYVGPVVGAVIGLFIGVVSVGNIELVWPIILVFILFQSLDNLILQPVIYSNSVKAHPLEIFLVILMAGSLAGIVGMLFAIPGYTVLRILAKEFFNEFRVVQSLTKNLD